MRTARHLVAIALIVGVMFTPTSAVSAAVTYAEQCDPDLTATSQALEPQSTGLEAVENEIGAEMARLGSEIVADAYVKDDPRIELLRAKLLTWGTNDNAASAMYLALGADETLALTEAVGGHVGLLSTNDDQRQRARQTLELLRTSLHHATTQWPAEDAEQFGRDMLNAACTPDPATHNPLNQPLPRTQALNWLLYDAAAASSAFVLGAARAMNDVVQSVPVREGADNWQWPGQTSFLPIMVDWGAQPWLADTPSVVFHSLAAHPQAAYEFFSADEFQALWWAGDYEFTTHGDLSGITAALDAASTNPEIMQDHPKQTATIAGMTIHTLASRDDFGGKEDQYGVEAAQSLEHIIETYLPAVARAYNDPRTVTATGPFTRNAVHPMTRQSIDIPSFSTWGLDAVIGVIGHDGQAFLDLRAAVTEAESAGLPPNPTHDDLIVAAVYWAALEGGIANAIGDAALGDEERRLDATIAWIELGTKPVSALADIATSYAPAGSGTSMSWTSDAMIENIASTFKDRVAGPDSDTAEAFEIMRYAAASALSNLELRLFFRADEAGLNGYQAEGGRTSDWENLTSAGVAVTMDDGSHRFITQEEYNLLPEAEQTAVRYTLVSLFASAGGSIDSSIIVKRTFDTLFRPVLKAAEEQDR